jgi:hypothetical protein
MYILVCVCRGSYADVCFLVSLSYRIEHRLVKAVSELSDLVNLLTRTFCNTY